MERLEMLQSTGALSVRHWKTGHLETLQSTGAVSVQHWKAGQLETLQSTGAVSVEHWKTGISSVLNRKADYERGGYIILLHVSNKPLETEKVPPQAFPVGSVSERRGVWGEG